MMRAPRATARRKVRWHFDRRDRLELELLEDRTLLSVSSGLPSQLLTKPLADKAPLRPGELAGEPSISPSDLAAAYAITTRPYVHPKMTADGVTPLASSSPIGLRPSQVRHAYGFDQIVFGGSIVGDGTGQTIAIIDAFDTPAAFTDLQAFDSAFGLSDPPSFTRVAQDGSSNFPSTNSGWALETALDVEWAHALAPNANILLVEGNSASYSDLMTAVDYARNTAGVSVVSMSFGSTEFFSETSLDSHFITPDGHSGVTFVASTGDDGTPGGYPAYSPNVVAVGGTTLHLNSSLSLPDYSNETGWTGSGGGVSTYESQPGCQQDLVPDTLTTDHRTIPDVSFDADPASGVAVYSSLAGGASTPWLQVGGTSFSAPAWGALVAVANQGRVLAGLGPVDGPTQTLPLIYELPAYDFHDVTIGSNGLSTSTGYDLVTGRGSPGANVVAAALAAPSVGGKVYVDANSNHTRDPGESGLAGWTVFDDQNNNGTLDLSGSGTFNSTDVPKAISDFSYVVSTATVSGLSDTIADLNVGVTLHHTSDSDLAITLVAPDGTAVPLATDGGGSGDNYLGTVFDDQAATPITDGSAPFSGSYRPINALAVLNGKSANGTWRLVVADNASGATGTLDNWSLTITTSTDLTTISEADGSYHFNTVAVGSHHYRAVVQAPYAPFTPVGGVYDVSTVSTTNLTTQDFGNVGPSVSGKVFLDSNANGSLELGESGLAGWVVYDDVNNNGTRDVPTQSSVPSSDVPKTIPDVSTVSSTISVVGLPTTLADLNLNFTLHHTYDSDLVITLTSPMGTQVTLVNREGGSGQNFINTTLDDAAATAISAGTAPFTGTYRPDGALAAFNGQNPNGVWTLTISDVASLDSGTLNNWSLIITAGTTEPSATTAADGSFLFTNVAAGTHHYREVLHSGYSETTPSGGAYDATVASYVNLSERNFGNFNGSMVAGRWLFYKGSTAWDVTNNNLPGFSDDNAIAPDKAAYLPGSGAATFANVSSYTRGINGLMVDLAGSHGAITANDFIFKVGNNNSPSLWATATPPTLVTTRAGAGNGGSDRVELIWANGAIQKQWLEVIVKGNDALGSSNTNTGLVASDTFYFGSAVADSGAGDSTAFVVNSTDEISARNDPHSTLSNPALITNVNDYNRDGNVNATDQVASRNNATSALSTALKFLSISAGGPFDPQTDLGDRGVASALASLADSSAEMTAPTYPLENVQPATVTLSQAAAIVAQITVSESASPSAYEPLAVDVDDELLELLSGGE